MEMKLSKFEKVMVMLVVLYFMISLYPTVRESIIELINYIK